MKMIKDEKEGVREERRRREDRERKNEGERDRSFKPLRLINHICGFLNLRSIVE